MGSRIVLQSADDLAYLPTEKRLGRQQIGEQFGCPFCEKSSLTEFTAKTHLSSHTGPFYICLVPNCRANIGEFRMTRHQLSAHEAAHKRNGHLDHLPNDQRHRIADARVTWVRTPREIHQHIATNISRDRQVEVLSYNLDKVQKGRSQRKQETIKAN